MPPSAWLLRFLPRVLAGRDALDVACGSGRHTRLLLEAGLGVTAVDIDLSEVADLAGHPRAELVEADLEDARPFPLRGRRFDAVVVTNYLHRPLLPDLVAAVAPGGVLVYETYAQGQERYGRPRNPAYLLEPGELLAAVAGELAVIAYEDGVCAHPRPARVQRLCASRSG